MGVELVPSDIVEDFSATNSDMVYQFRLALRSKSASSDDTKYYNEIVEYLGLRHYTIEQAPYLITTIHVLSWVVADLDYQCHDQLLDRIFNMPLCNLWPNARKALLELIKSMAASNGNLLDSCLKMLIQNFTPPIDKRTERLGLERKGSVLPEIHATLEALFQLVPMAADRISLILLENMPWNPKTKYDQLLMKRQLIFVENMLKLARGPSREFVEERILKNLMIMLRDVDVLIGCDNNLHEDSSKGIFSMELDDELASTLSEKNYSDSDMAEMLDSLMVQTFEHLDSAAHNKHLHKVFDMLLITFEEVVLTTEKTKFAQFVMFYACALDPEHCGRKFADWLMDMFENNSNPLKKMSAVAYLASFLARAKFLDSDFIRLESVANYLESLVGWCCQYCAKHDSDMNPTLDKHEVFYSGCQAIMHVLCFHMRSIMGCHELRSKLVSMPLESILKHRLDPLTVCSRPIVEEFLKQAKAAGLFVFEGLLGPKVLRSFGGFPFDPCMLNNSDSNFIKYHYAYWKYVKTTYDDEDNYPIEDDDEEGGRDDEEAVADDYEVAYMEEGISRSFDMAENAFSKMSFTPGNSSSLEQRFEAQGLQRMPSRIRPHESRIIVNDGQSSARGLLF